jgi:hypothetical protein
MPVKSRGVPLKSRGIPVKSRGVPLKSRGIPLKSHGVPLKSRGVPVYVQRFIARLYIPLCKYKLDGESTRCRDAISNMFDGFISGVVTYAAEREKDGFI